MPSDVKQRLGTRLPTWLILSRWWAASALALLAGTWRLWIPRSEFPQVPLFGWSARIPISLEWFSLGIAVTALLTAACVRRDARPVRSIAWRSFAVAMTVLWLVNQHRLQPWAWQIVLMSFAFASSLDDSSKRRWLRLLTVSIYFWSALSKMDNWFCYTHGETFVAVLWAMLGGKTLERSTAWSLAPLFPIGELLVAVGLTITRYRNVARWGAIGLHVLLLLILGPFGLGHSAGVLLWNVAFLGHDWLLFWHRDESSRSESLACEPLVWRPFGITQCVIGIACLLPILERFNWFDRWPAWAVYSARGERVTVVLTTEAQQRLPASTRRVVNGDELPLDRWSLEELNVPTYPQLRFQCGVIEWLRHECGDEAIIEVTLRTPGTFAKMPFVTERFTLSEWQRVRETFWLNTIPHETNHD